MDRPPVDAIRIVGTRLFIPIREDATLTLSRPLLEIYNGFPLSVRVVEVPGMALTVVPLITPAGMTLELFADTLATVAARFTRAPVVAVRDDVVLRPDEARVVVRATDAPDELRVAVAVVRPAPPVARVAAAFVAAVFDVARVAAVDVVRDVVVPRDATEREVVAVRGEGFDVVRAATAREEFAADARPVAAVVVDVGKLRPIVVRFVFERAAGALRDV